MATETNDQLLKGFFKMDVKFSKNHYGDSAKWNSQFHPDNVNFMQKVHWIAYENHDRTKIIFRYSLDLQRSTMYDYKTIDHSGNFEDAVFALYKEQIMTDKTTAIHETKR